MEPIGEPRFLHLPSSAFHQVLVELHDIVMQTTTRFWRERGLRYAFLPITTNAVSSPAGPGSDSNPVQVRLGDVDTYLADSMQFFLEYACRFHQAGAYYVMPSFRGEDTDQTHLSQFMHCETEMAGDLSTLIDQVEDFLLLLNENILTAFRQRDHLFPAGTGHIKQFLMSGKHAFTRLTFEEAVTALSDIPNAIALVDGGGRTLTRIGESALMDRFGDFVWITHWDQKAVPFYQRHIDTPSGPVAVNADLIFGPAGEVIGAGERHIDGSSVSDALLAHGIDPADYHWYTQMKAMYPMLTSGFGLGVERFLMWVLHHDDIRDLQLLPRDMKNSHVP